MGYRPGVPETAQNCSRHSDRCRLCVPYLSASILPVVQIGNITQTIEELKKLGFWIAGADMNGEDYYKSNLTGPMVIVVGAEGKGLGRLVKEKCDIIVSLPMQGGVSSLNASAAGAVLLYEVVRQRRVQAGV